MTARRMISGLLRTPLKGSVFVMNKGYETTLPASSRLVLTKPRRFMQTFRSFNSAAATLTGIEVARMIRKGQFGRPGKSGFEQIAEFAG